MAALLVAAATPSPCIPLLPPLLPLATIASRRWFLLGRPVLLAGLPCLPLRWALLWLAGLASAAIPIELASRHLLSDLALAALIAFPHGRSANRGRLRPAVLLVAALAGALWCPATGLPVVVADDSGCGEVIASTGGGLVVRGEAGALQSALAHILSAPDHWRAAACHAANHVRSLYAPSIVCAQLEAVYQEMAAAA